LFSITYGRGWYEGKGGKASLEGGIGVGRGGEKGREIDQVKQAKRQRGEMIKEKSRGSVGVNDTGNAEQFRVGYKGGATKKA